MRIYNIFYITCIIINYIVLLNKAYPSGWIANISPKTCSRKSYRESTGNIPGILNNMRLVRALHLKKKIILAN